MSTAIDTVTPPDEIYGHEENSVHRNATVTVEAIEIQKLTRIAAAVYDFLYQGSPRKTLQDACDDYSAYCGVISKKEGAREKQERRENRAKDDVVHALEKLDKAMQKKGPPYEIRELCEDLVSAYVSVVRLRRAKAGKSA